MKIVLLINLKLLTIADSFFRNRAEHENFSANKYENANYHSYLLAEKISCSAELCMKKSFMTLRPGRVGVSIMWLLKHPGVKVVSAPAFRTRGPWFVSRCRYISAHDSMAFHCPEPFIITLQSSLYDLNNVERDVKYHIIILMCLLIVSRHV